MPQTIEYTVESKKVLRIICRDGPMNGFTVKLRSEISTLDEVTAALQALQRDGLIAASNEFFDTAIVERTHFSLLPSAFERAREILGVSN